ncbi:MAG: uroporphyrinogen-III synthase [Nitriliruptorales bacterium]|nr:uroporphyrinogen-III synthase [Nitriliruptorales bacterium]
MAGALEGVRVLVPRSADQAPELSDRIRELDGEPIEAPVIDIQPGDEDAIRLACERLARGDFDAVAFTSPNGARAVAGVAGAAPAREWRVDLVAAVGPGTARAVRDELHIEVDLIPSTATTVALADAFPDGPGVVLLPRADLATPQLADVLGGKGWEVHEVTAYVTARPATLPDDAEEALQAGQIDLVAVASSSTARNLSELVDDLGGAQIVSIGPVTSRTCRELGLDVAAEADPHTIDGLVKALVRAATG